MAPTNDAFDLLPEDLRRCLFAPQYVETLRDVLMYHVAEGEFQLFNFQFIDMLNLDSILITIEANGFPVINDKSDVIQSDILATNGIAYGINAILNPPTFDPQVFRDFCLGDTDEPTTDVPTDDPEPTDGPTKESEPYTIPLEERHGCANDLSCSQTDYSCCDCEFNEFDCADNAGFWSLDCGWCFPC